MRSRARTIKRLVVGGHVIKAFDQGGGWFSVSLDGYNLLITKGERARRICESVARNLQYALGRKSRSRS
jgi:hypothetical protein